VQKRPWQPPGTFDERSRVEKAQNPFSDLRLSVVSFSGSGLRLVDPEFDDVCENVLAH
jgi:hypothetical protein